jgi:Tfp pilus assembly protein PilE
MKVIGITSAAILSLLLGIAAPAYAQHEEQGERKDHAQQVGHEQGRSEQRGQQQRSQHNQQQTQDRQQQAQHNQQQTQDSQQQQAQRNRQQAQDSQQHAQRNQQQARARLQPQRTYQQQRVKQSAWQEHRSQHWQSDHRNWQQRGGYRGYRIPDERYRGYLALATDSASTAFPSWL